MDNSQSKEATDVAAPPAVDAAPPALAEGGEAAAAVSELETKPAANIANTREPSDEDDVSEASDITDVAIAVGLDEEENHFLDDDVNAAPMHLHALKGVTNARLRGRGLPRHNSDGKLVSSGGGSLGGRSTRSMGGGGGSTRSMGEPIGSAAKGGRRSRSTSRSRGGRRGGGGTRSANSSRSSSPVPARKLHDHASVDAAGSTLGGSFTTGVNRGDASTAHSAYSNAHSHPHSSHSVHSGHSSLDGIFDPDLLLDRLGFIDLDPPLPHEIRCGPLAAPGTLEGKSNNSGGLTPVNERLSEETLEDCHAFSDLVMIDNLRHHLSHHGGGMSSTMSMPSVAHSSLSGMRSDMSVGSLSVGSFKGGAHSRGGSVAGGSLMGDGENSVLLGTLDEEGEDEESVPEVEAEPVASVPEAEPAAVVGED